MLLSTVNMCLPNYPFNLFQASFEIATHTYTNGFFLPFRLMLGFMGITMFFSMWMSNTATTAMVVPMVEAVVERLTEVSYRTNLL